MRYNLKRASSFSDIWQWRMRRDEENVPGHNFFGGHPNFSIRRVPKQVSLKSSVVIPLVLPITSWILVNAWRVQDRRRWLCIIMYIRTSDCLLTFLRRRRRNNIGRKPENTSNVAFLPCSNREIHGLVSPISP